MFPLVPALVLAFISFIASAFVILRIVIPILPPHPLSRRVSPAEFGLPTFRSLSPADKSHIWLASLDLVALAIFVWQIVAESTTGPTGVKLATDPASAIRLWILVTIRQTCLLMVFSMTLLHVRMANSVSFGKKHWMLWAPTALLVITSTTIAGLLSGTGVDTLFYGLTAYSTTLAVLSSVAFGCLIRTLFVIKKNLSSLNEASDTWPPVRQIEEKPRPSFATEDIDAIRDGASWITSSAGSRRNSVSAWSFSTHHTVTTSHHHGHGRPQSQTHPSVPAKSSFWFGSTTPNDIQVPPVPPLPSPYGPTSPTSAGLADPDPFRRDLPPLPDHPRTRLGSQTSWLTSSNGSHATLTSWSYPTTQYEGTIRSASTTDFQTALIPGTRPTTPALADALVLGGYGYAPGNAEAEKGLASLAAPTGTTIHISMLPALGWSVMIWLPLGFALPYLVLLSQHNLPSTVIQILFILSVTLSSPFLAINILVGSPLPIPVGLFDVRGQLPAETNLPCVGGSLPPQKWSHEYKRSTSCSVTVVEGRRSGDVWLTKGDAVDGKGKFGRAMTMLSATPKLSVLPPEDNDDQFDMPPIPFQNDDSLPVNVNGTPHSENSVQFGRIRNNSKESSHYSGGDESMAFASRIMIAQRHYSALAQTVVVPGSSNAGGTRESAGASTLVSAASGAASKRASHSSHLRSRSVSSVNNGPQTPTERDAFDISPPPSFPLPPTPPNVRAARLAMLAHKKSFSSGFSLGPVDDLNEIDAMTAGVLPLLVPGLTVGEDMKIKKGDYSPPGTFSKSKGKKVAKKLTEFGEDFSSPEVHSTPARLRQPRGRKESHKNHFSLPSLSLGKEGMHSLAAWSAEIRNALEHKVGQYTAIPSNVELGRRNTVLGVETSNALSSLQTVEEEDVKIIKEATGLDRSRSTRSLGLSADVPHNVDTARSSIASLANLPTSAASTTTLFDDFEAGLQSGPQAESTPHNTVSQKPVSRHPPPPMPDHRRSSIRYIKSDNIQNESITYPMEDTTNSEPAISAMTSIAQWSSRAVRPLIPKSSKLQRSPSDGTSGKESGLRQLTLLQDRGNIVNNSANTGRMSPTLTQIRPLTLGKKQKSRVALAHQDENVNPGASPRSSKNIKSLTLARSETSKVRGILRQTEVLPDFVVRPPSMIQRTDYAYSVRD